MLTIDWLFRARGKGGIPFLHIAREFEDIQTGRHKVLSLLAMIRPEAGLNAVKNVVRGVGLLLLSKVAEDVMAAVDVEIAKKLMFGRKTGLPF